MEILLHRFIIIFTIKILSLFNWALDTDAEFDNFDPMNCNVERNTNQLGGKHKDKVENMKKLGKNDK